MWTTRVGRRSPVHQVHSCGPLGSGRRSPVHQVRSCGPLGPGRRSPVHQVHSWGPLGVVVDLRSTRSIHVDHSGGGRLVHVGAGPCRGGGGLGDWSTRSIHVDHSGGVVDLRSTRSVHVDHSGSGRRSPVHQVHSCGPTRGA